MMHANSSVEVWVRFRAIKMLHGLVYSAMTVPIEHLIIKKLCMTKVMARYEWRMSLKFAKGILPGEKEFVYSR